MRLASEERVAHLEEQVRALTAAVNDLLLREQHDMRPRVSGLEGAMGDVAHNLPVMMADVATLKEEVVALRARLNAQDPVWLGPVSVVVGDATDAAPDCSGGFCQYPDACRCVSPAPSGS